MADFNSSLPVRSESDSAEGINSKVVVKINDGTLGGTNQMSVDADKNAHVEMHGNKTSDGSDVVQQLTEEGRTTSRGDYNVTTNSKPSSNGTIIHVRNATPTEVHQTLRPTGINSSVNTNVFAQDVAIRDEQGNPFTEDNPMPVTIVDSEGVEVNDYNTAAAVAANAVSNHDYTVTAAKRLKLSGIMASGSGKMKVEVQVETGVATGTFTTKFVGFNSTSVPNVMIPIAEPITVAAGVKVRVIRTNKDLLAQDVYSTICGHEIT